MSDLDSTKVLFHVRDMTLAPTCNHMLAVDWEVSQGSSGAVAVEQNQGFSWTPTVTDRHRCFEFDYLIIIIFVSHCSVKIL